MTTSRQQKKSSVYEHIREKNNPNRYYYTEKVDILIASTPSKNHIETQIIASLNAHIEQATLQQGTRIIDLFKLESGFWQANITHNVAFERDWLLSLHVGEIVYYKPLQINSTEEIQLFSHSEQAIDTFSIHPKNYAADLYQVPIHTKQAFGRENLLQGSILGVTSNLDIRGIKTISMRTKQTKSNEGNEETRHRDELLMLNINGEVGPVKVAATIQDSSINLEDSNPNTLEFFTDTWSIYFGEYASDMKNISLAAYHKRLDGAKVHYHNGPYSIQVMMSESKGQSEYEEQYGNDSQGPYYLKHSPIIVNSETIQLRGRALVRDTDYIIDYELGEITFKTDIVESIEIFSINYEYADSLFKRNFKAFDFQYKSTDNRRERSFSFQNLSDVKSGKTENATPKEHSVLASKVKEPIGKHIQLEQEIGLSYFDNNSLSEGEDSQDLAIKQGIQINKESFQAGLHITKVGDQYKPIGGLSLKPGLWNYDIDFQLSSDSAYSVAGGHSHDIYYENGQPVSNTDIDFSSSIKNFSYSYHQHRNLDRSSDISPFDKQLAKHTIGYEKQIGRVVLKPESDLEILNDSYNQSYDARHESIRLSSHLVGYDTIQISSQVEFQKEMSRAFSNAYKNTYSGMVSIEPHSKLSIDGTAQVIDDSTRGISALSSLSYYSRLSKKLKTSGHYDLETIEEQFGSDTYRSMKHDANIKMTWRPSRLVKVKYRIKPSGTFIPSLSQLSAESRLTHQLNTDLIPHDSWTLGLAYKESSKTEKDRENIKENITKRSQKQHTYLLQSLFTLSETEELNYALDFTTDLEWSSEEKTTQLRELHEWTYSNRITKHFTLRGEYELNKDRTDKRIDKASRQWTETQTLRSSGEWDVSRKLSLKSTLAGSKHSYIIGDESDGYSIAPRLDIYLRPLPNWQWDAFIEASKSISGSPIRKNRFSIRTRYDVNVVSIFDFNISAQLDLDETLAPSFKQIWESVIQINMLF